MKLLGLNRVEMLVHDPDQAEYARHTAREGATGLAGLGITPLCAEQGDPAVRRDVL